MGTNNGVGTRVEAGIRGVERGGCIGTRSLREIREQEERGRGGRETRERMEKVER